MRSNLLWACTVCPRPAGTLPWRSEREAAPGTTTTYGAGGADSLQLQLLPSPPQEGPVVGEGATPQQQQLLSKGEVLQRKLECLEQPQLLITSIPCPQVPSLPARLPACAGPAAPLPLPCRSLAAYPLACVPTGCPTRDHHHPINWLPQYVFHALPYRPLWRLATTWRSWTSQMSQTCLTCAPC
jgi:hypothetical protein